MTGVPAINQPPAPRTFLGGEGLKIWTNPRAKQNIIVLSGCCLYTSSIVNRDLARAVQMLNGGASPEQVFGSHLQVIPLISVQEARINLKNNSFWFSFLSGIGSASAEIQLANSLEADELLTVLRSQFGSQFRVEKLGLNLSKTFGWPAMALVIHIILSIGLWSLVAPKNGVRRRDMPIATWLQDNLGSSGSLLLIGVVAAAIILWAVARVLQRPVGLSFTKASH